MIEIGGKVFRSLPKSVMLQIDAYTGRHKDGSNAVLTAAHVFDRRGFDVVRGRAGGGAKFADRSARTGALLSRAQAA